MRNILKISSLFLVVLSLVLLCGCAPKNVEKAKEKMKEAGYTCLGYEGDGEKEGLVGGFSASRLESGELDTIFALLYDSSKSAKEALTSVEEALEGEQVAEVIGKWVVRGTEQAIKDFK